MKLLGPRIVLKLWHPIDLRRESSILNAEVSVLRGKVSSLTHENHSLPARIGSAVPPLPFVGVSGGTGAALGEEAKQVAEEQYREFITVVEQQKSEHLAVRLFKSLNETMISTCDSLGICNKKATSMDIARMWSMRTLETIFHHVCHHCV